MKFMSMYFMLYCIFMRHDRPCARTLIRDHMRTPMKHTQAMQRCNIIAHHNSNLSRVSVCPCAILILYCASSFMSNVVMDHHATV